MKTKKGTCNVLQYMDTIVQNKRKIGKAGTANVYQSVRNHFSLFCEKEPRAVNCLESYIVQGFKEYLQSCKLSVNTISNYLSVLRAVYNKALAEQQMKSDGNSFNKLKLHPVSTYKRSVSMDTIMEINTLDLKEERLIFTWDIFVFSFMAYGISFVDLSHLTRANIINNCLVYRRAKTKTEIRVTITASMRRLIDHYSDEKSNYLFPILKGGETYEQYKAVLRTYNRRLNKIGQLSSCPIKLTSYVARHSWAMRAKENNVPIAVIGEALGHTSEVTTRFYLSNLDPSVLEKVNQKITIRLDECIMSRYFKNDPCLQNKGQAYNLQ